MHAPENLWKPTLNILKIKWRLKGHHPPRPFRRSSRRSKYSIRSTTTRRDSWTTKNVQPSAATGWIVNFCNTLQKLNHVKWLEYGSMWSVSYISAILSFPSYLTIPLSILAQLLILLILLRLTVALLKKLREHPRLSGYNGWEVARVIKI